MPFYMDHPEHGAHICYTPEDVAEHEKIGWVLRSDKAKEAPKEPVKSEVDDLRAQLDAAGVSYDRRWGAARLREALG